MCCVITDGKYYLSTDSIGKRTKIGDPHKAMQFDNENKATNYIQNCMNQKEREKWGVKELTPKLIIDETISKVIKLPELSEYCEIDWNSETEYIKQLSNKLNKNKEILSYKHSQIEKQKINLEHEIENSRYNASQGYKKLAEYQELLHKRREVKNNLEMIGVFLQFDFVKDNVDEIIKKLEYINNPTFKPREVDLQIVS